ncbi:MFS transporter [Desulfosarcina ovata]|uniref:MFS transporter n=1 Tax=Desulfosarcina ovata TaxID=83564 RepID=UPI0012D36DC2|nr:MFS transporter [Desulfosarcina ovata]
MASLQFNPPKSTAIAKGIDRKLPGGIWVLGFVSMFMDISSELVHSLLPISMATILGASMVTIGIVEGVAEGTAAITKIFSGAISDYFGKRKFLAVLGYAMGAISKPIFPLATTMGWVFGARFVDRKGLLSKLVADTALVELRGTAFGIFNLVSGGALLLASVIAGSLWNVFGASATFIAGASFATLAAIGLLLCRPDARVTISHRAS